MPRSLWRDTVMVRGPAGTMPLSGAVVYFYEDNGTPYVPIAFPLYASATSADPLRMPIFTGSLGEVEVWADAPQRIRLVATKAGLSTADEVIDLAIPPDTAASGGDVSQAISDHLDDPNPHPQYLTQDEGDLRYLPIDYSPDLTNYYTKPEADAAFLSKAEGAALDARVTALETKTVIDIELRAYVQAIMAVLDPGGPPPP